MWIDSKIFKEGKKVKIKSIPPHTSRFIYITKFETIFPSQGKKEALCFWCLPCVMFERRSSLGKGGGPGSPARASIQHFSTRIPEGPAYKCLYCLPVLHSVGWPFCSVSPQKFSSCTQGFRLSYPLCLEKFKNQKGCGLKCWSVEPHMEGKTQGNEKAHLSGLNGRFSGLESGIQLFKLHWTEVPELPHPTDMHTLCSFSYLLDYVGVSPLWHRL